MSEMNELRNFVKCALLESRWDSDARRHTRVIFGEWKKRLQSSAFEFYGLSALDFETTHDMVKYHVINHELDEETKKTSNIALDGAISQGHRTIILNVFIAFDGTSSSVNLSEAHNQFSVVIRHELEHLRQYAMGEDDGTPSTMRNSENGNDDWFAYLTHPNEVGAFVSESYFDAKKKKVPASYVMTNTLNTFRQFLSDKEYDEIYAIWMAFGQKRFPKGFR